jgi:hypothetical protein
MTDQPQSPNDGADPYLRSGRAGEVHATPARPEWGEGVITGDAPDHYVHLANGAVLAGSSGGTAFHDAETDTLIPIVRVFAAGRELPR